MSREWNLDDAANELERLYKDSTIQKIAYDGLSSLLLEVQQECIELKKENERLREIVSRAMECIDADDVIGAYENLTKAEEPQDE